MATRSCYFKGEAGIRYDLSETDDLFIVRTRQIDADFILSTIRQLDIFRKFFKKFDAFPESCVYLYRCSDIGNLAAFRDEIKKIIRDSGHPLLCYVGTVFKFTGTEIYQIYTGNIFIKFYDDVNSSRIRKIFTEKKIRNKEDIHFGLNVFFTEAQSEIGRDVFDLSQSLLALKEVECCHPELVIKARKALSSVQEVPEPYLLDDPLWAFKKTGVIEAWKTSTGNNIRLCIIDDGLELNHLAFAGNQKIVAWRDMMDKGGRRFPYHQFDECHGTACASIACSADPNAYGVAPNATLIPIRISGLGSVLQSEAFYWAREQNADVISCSWGPPDGNIFTDKDNDFLFPIPDHTDLAIRYVTSHGRKGKGTVVVFAAGNGNEPIKNDGYASHECVIAVGAVGQTDQPTIYSDYGAPMLCCFPSGDYRKLDGDRIEKLDGIKVADRLGSDGYAKDLYYDFFTGTSASCPGVAGTIALMLAANPNLSQGDVRTIIKNASRKIGDQQSYVRGYSEHYGYGMLMADRAVQLALQHKTLNASHLMDQESTESHALSLHIGINEVDSYYYQANIPQLRGCLNDMANMETLAKGLNYETHTLENAQATRENIQQKIETLGKRLAPGGILLVTYAGHGAPVPDTDNDENERYDESWVTYDGFLLDDEINNCLATIPAGRRVVLVSDSCHSRSVARFISWGDTRVRGIDKTAVKAILKANDQSVKGLRSGIGGRQEPKAFVKTLSACDDDQFAKETGDAGVFSTHLLAIFGELQSQTITYATFIEAINNRMNDQQQIAGILNSGAESEDFDNQFPFLNSITSLNPNLPPKPSVQNPPPRIPEKSDILIVKSRKSTIKLPIRTSGRSAAPGFRELRIIGGKNDPALPQGDLDKVSTGTLDATEIPGHKSWDKAYEVILTNPGAEIEYVEPEIASNLYCGDLTAQAGSTRGTTEPEFIPTYPNPGRGSRAYTWHLDDQHSQLKRANETVFPEIKYQDFPASPDQVIKIAHIDTGYLPYHPALPVNLDPAAVTFTDGRIVEGATDFDLPLALVEQQGHGNGTLAILAGGKVQDEDTDGEFRGFFGAIPFARVLSLKIGDNVAILSGKKFAAAVDYAIAQKCDVITMSMAGLPSKTMAEAVNKAYRHGIIIVSAAGNNFVKGGGRTLPDTTLYPARYPQVIAAVGAAIDEKPYLYNEHNAALRGGAHEYMQMNYGPEDALGTTLAAYTPNLVWFNRYDKNATGKDRYFTKRGGGTSCATPQIAAAAALYIHYHRAELERIAGIDKWKIVEMVKSALFSSASRANPSFRKYYGNGVLRAYDALVIEPAKLSDKITKAKDADSGGNIFKRLFRIFTGRSTFGLQTAGVDARLQSMMNMEITQLLHRDSNLHKYLNQIDFDNNDALVSITDQEAFVRDIQNSDKASDFLKRRLVIPAEASISSTMRNLRSAQVEFSNYVINTKKGTIEIRTEGIASSVSAIATDQRIEGWQGGTYHEFEIQISNSFGSRGGSSLSITDDFDNLNMDSALLIERKVDGVPLLQWQLKGGLPQMPPTLRGAFGETVNIIESDQFFIDLHSADSVGTRGGGFNIVKLAIKVFSWLRNPKKKAKDTGFDHLLSKMGDSKYELLVYDLNQEDGTGREWQKTEELPGIFETIKNDRPLLVLVPGLLSTVEKGFDEFLANDAVVKGLKSRFGRYVLGFNMPTLVVGIDANARQFNKMLIGAGLQGKQCSVIGRSSGGLVARALFEDVLFDQKEKTTVKSAPLLLDKLVVIGTSNQGTLLASKENWTNYVNIASTVANLAGLLSPIIPQVMGILKAIIDTAIQLPGISDLDEKSEAILKLNRIDTDRLKYLIITSNFEPNGLLKKLFNEGIIDQLIFKGEDNDTLTPVLGALFRNPDLPVDFSLYDNQFHIASEGDQVNHFGYLEERNKVIVEKILNWI